MSLGYPRRNALNSASASSQELPPRRPVLALLSGLPPACWSARHGPGLPDRPPVPVAWRHVPRRCCRARQSWSWLRRAQHGHPTRFASSANRSGCSITLRRQAGERPLPGQRRARPEADAFRFGMRARTRQEGHRLAFAPTWSTHEVNDFRVIERRGTAVERVAERSTSNPTLSARPLNPK